MCGLCLRLRWRRRGHLSNDDGSECSSVPPLCSDAFKQLLCDVDCRGPDYQETLSCCQAGVEMVAHASVLSMRRRRSGPATDTAGSIGGGIVPQPLQLVVSEDLNSSKASERQPKEESAPSFLMWNGELFGGSLCPRDEGDVTGAPGGSDTEAVGSALATLEAAVVAMGKVDVADTSTSGPSGSTVDALLAEATDINTDDTSSGNIADELFMTAEQRERRERPVLIGDSDGLTFASCSSASLSLTPQEARRRVFLRRCADLLEREAQGPYAFVYVARRLGMVVYGRDPLGRRSLVTRVGRVSSAENAAPADGEELRASEGECELIICSVSGGHEEGSDKTTAGGWREVPVSGLFAVSFEEDWGDSKGAHSAVRLLQVPWSSPLHRCHPLMRPLLIGCCTSANYSACVGAPLRFPDVGVLHSRISSLSPLLTAQLTCHAVKRTTLWYLSALLGAVHRRVCPSTTNRGNGDRREASAGHPVTPVGVLFSGGIDCTVLAALAHYVLPPDVPIELVNVAFGESPMQAPDRISALSAVAELLRLPNAAGEGGEGRTGARRLREWRLVLVDAPCPAANSHPGGISISSSTHSAASLAAGEEEAAAMAAKRVWRLVAPRRTVMDADIGVAVWHAAQGRGRLQRLTSLDVEEEVVEEEEEGEEREAASLAGGSSRGGRGADNSRDDVLRLSKHYRVDDEAGWRKDCEERRALRRLEPASRQRGKKEGDTPDDDGVVSEESAEEKFAPLVEALVTDAVTSGEGPANGTLFSTLGNEYGALLQPHLQRYRYRRLGAFITDAIRAGFVELCGQSAASAKGPLGSAKAVRLVRPQDLQRAQPPPPCPWFRTRSMRRQQQQQQAPPQTDEAASTPTPGSWAASYTCEARALLLGMGADETLGGYLRFRRLYARAGMRGVAAELQHDYGCLWSRNLGRDDRVVADSGRESRLPFLDEEVLATLAGIVAAQDSGLGAELAQQQQQHQQHALLGASAPAEVPSAPAQWSEAFSQRVAAALSPVVDLSLGPGVGDKHILRDAAAAIGLGDVCHLQKRAIQFGSRIASSKMRGSEEVT